MFSLSLGATCPRVLPITWLGMTEKTAAVAAVFLIKVLLGIFVWLITVRLAGVVV